MWLLEPNILQKFILALSPTNEKFLPARSWLVTVLEPDPLSDLPVECTDVLLGLLLIVGDAQSGTGGLFVDWLMIHRALTPSSSQPTAWRDTFGP